MRRTKGSPSFMSVNTLGLRICLAIILFLAPASGADVSNCSVRITVDQSVTDAGNCTASGVCSDLQDVLLRVARRAVFSPDCVDISVTEGVYLLTEDISISHNLRLRGEGNVTVRFNFSERSDPRRTSQPHYLLSFSNVSHVELSGLDFYDSPGIITIFSVTSVVVEDCSFR